MTFCKPWEHAFSRRQILGAGLALTGGARPRLAARSRGGRGSQEAAQAGALHLDRRRNEPARELGSQAEYALRRAVPGDRLRTKNGSFKTVDDLEKVPGIGPGLMKQIRSQVSTSGKTMIDKPAQKTSKTTKSTAKAAEPAKSDGLKSDKASGKSAEKPTTGTKVEEKKTK